MVKFYEVAAYASPDENNGIPGLIDCFGSYIPEEEVVQAARSMFIAAPYEVRDDCHYSGNLWKVGIAETDPARRGYVNEPKGVFPDGTPFTTAKHQWFASLEEVKKVFR